MSDKRYAKVGDLVLHRRTGEIGRIVSVYPLNEYLISGKPVSCPVAVMDSGTPFLDVPGKALFDFLPDGIEPAIESLRKMFDACISDAIHGLAKSYEIDEPIAMAIVGSVIRERMKKET